MFDAMGYVLDAMGHVLDAMGAWGTCLGYVLYTQESRVDQGGGILSIVNSRFDIVYGE